MKPNMNTYRYMAGLILGLLSLVGAVFFYWQSLVYEFVPVRMPIPKSELKPTSGVGACWSVPESLRPKYWSRTPVRVLEEGKALPLRVETEVLVLDQGQGRFCLQGQLLWFSTPDKSNPLTNGRNYEFEAHKRTYRDAITAGVFLILSAGLLMLCVLRREGREYLLRLIPTRNQRLRWFCTLGAIACLGLAIGSVFCHRLVPIAPEMVIQQSDGHFSYFLPRWMRRHTLRVESACLFENQKPLRRIPLQDLKNAAPGSFVVQGDYVRFQPMDLSAPKPNGRSYHLKVLYFPWRGWTLALSGIGLFLMAFAYFPRGWWKLILVSLGPPLVSLGQWFWGQSGNKDQTQGSRPTLDKVSWWVPILILSLFKLWIIAGDDPIGQPADSLGYAGSALQMVWGGDFDLPTHPSGFPFVAGLVAQFGFSWRMALEMFYLGACSYLGWVVIGLTGFRLPGLLLFGFMAWHPWTFSGFREFMSDPFILVLFVLLLASMFRVFSQPVTQWRWSEFLILGIVLFFWEWSRHEEILLYVSYGLFMVLALLGVRRDGEWRQQLRRAAAMLLLPLLITVALSTTVKYVMLQRRGVYAKSLLQSPGIAALSKSLYQVQPEKVIRYAPVTRQSLRAACEASPTLKAFEAALIDSNAPCAVAGYAITKVPGEFGPYLYYQLHFSLPRDRRTAEELMLKAAGEIEVALRQGRLPKRRAFYPLDPNWQFWVPELPRLFFEWFGHGAYMSPAGEPWGTFHSPLWQQAFDQAANRREANIYPRLFLGQGTLTAPPGAIDSVALCDLEGRWLGATRLIPTNWFETVPAFDLRFPLVEDPEGYRLVFLRKEKPRYSFEFKLPPNSFKPTPTCEIEAFRKGETNVVLAETGETISYDFMAGVSVAEKKPRRESWEQFLATKYKPGLMIGLGLIFVSLLLRRSWSRQQLWAGVLCLLLTVGWFSLRTGFYSVFQSQFSYGVIRHMRCVCPLFVLMLFLAVIVAGVWLRVAVSWARRRSAQKG